MTLRHHLLYLFSVFSLCLFFTRVAESQPWRNPLNIAYSNDGITFNAPVTYQDSSGVPSAIRWKGDTLICAFQWFRQPVGSTSWDRVAVKFSFNNGYNWTSPVPIVVNGLPASYQRPFDPTLALIQNDSIRIYFSSSNGMPPPGSDSMINTYSAKSGDGINYYFEPGARVDHPTGRVIDPAVIYFNNSWHYIAPVGAPQQGAYHYVSPNGLNFSMVPNIPSDPQHNWTGNYVVNGLNDLRFYGTGVPNLWYNSTPNGGVWNGYVNTNLPGGDPTVVKQSGSNYLIIYTGAPYTQVINNEDTPLSYSLLQNFPNPFNSSTIISYEIPKKTFVNMRVFDILGNEIEVLANGTINSGTYKINWNASIYPAGVYFCCLKTDTYTTTKKLLLLK